LDADLDTDDTQEFSVAMHPNTLYIAKEAQQMAKNAKGDDCAVFQKVALVSMCLMAAAGTSQVLLSLWRELNRKEDRQRGRGR